LDDICPLATRTIIGTRSPGRPSAPRRARDCVRIWTFARHDRLIELSSWPHESFAAIIGAATGRHGVAITACASLALASYLVNALAPLVHELDKIRWISPWYHYAAGDPLRKGLAVDHALVLATLFVAAAIIVPVVFRRRDLA
jgi:hypothetical protein